MASGVASWPVASFEVGNAPRTVGLGATADPSLVELLPQAVKLAKTAKPMAVLKSVFCTMHLEEVEGIFGVVRWREQTHGRI
ncbi:MAG: hypothetical protein NVS3B2_02960 [Ramlibacter sp.]